MKIIYRVKKKGILIGYILRDTDNHLFFVTRNNIGSFTLPDVTVLKDFSVRAKYKIQDIDYSNIAIISGRQSYLVGKPNTLIIFDKARLSKTQLSILDRFNQSTLDYIVITKKIDSIKITMKDIACLTAVTNIEYALS